MLTHKLIDESRDMVKFKLNSILSEPIEILIKSGIHIDNRITLNPGEDEFEFSGEYFKDYAVQLGKDGLQSFYQCIGISAIELLEKYGIEKEEASKIVKDNDYGYDILCKLYKAYLDIENSEKRLEYAKVLKNVQRYYNDRFVTINNDRSCIVLDTGILTIEILDIPEAASIEIDGETIIFLDNKKSIKRKLSQGIHLIYVYNDNNELLQRFFYVSLNDEDIKFFDQEYNKKIEYRDSVVTEEDEVDKILQVMNYFDNDTPILSIPKIEVIDDKNNLIIKLFPEQTRNYSLINSLIYHLKDNFVILCLSEMDELFNKKANYRYYICTSWGLNDSNTAIFFTPQLNNEKYFYWLQDENGNKLSTIGVFDPTGEDTIDYNLLFAKMRFNKHYDEYMKKSDYQDKIHSILEEIRNSEDLPYIDVVSELKNKIVESIINEQEAFDLINYCENCLSKYTKHFDHELLNPIVVKNNYKEVLVSAKNNNGNFYIIADYINYNHISEYDINSLCVVQLAESDKVDRFISCDNIIITFRILNTDNWTISRPVVISFDKNGRIRRIDTNGLEKEVINGL